MGMQITLHLLAGWNVLGMSLTHCANMMLTRKNLLLHDIVCVWVVSQAGVGKYSCALAGNPFNILQN